MIHEPSNNCFALELISFINIWLNKVFLPSLFSFFLHFFPSFYVVFFPLFFLLSFLFFPSLCSFLSFFLRFKSNDASEFYYKYIWDITLLEFIVCILCIWHGYGALWPVVNTDVVHLLTARILHFYFNHYVVSQSTSLLY